MGLFDRSSSSSSTDQSVTTNETGISGASNTVVQGGGTLDIAARDKFNLAGAEGVTIQQSDPAAFEALADIVRGSSASSERTTLAALDATRGAAATAGAIAQGVPQVDFKAIAWPLGIFLAGVAIVVAAWKAFK